jgi:dipeptidyl aminopeptidase/acylaminoacyl peptidase
MAISRQSALTAIQNVARHGDTDIFPFPLENHWFHDDEAAVCDLLMEIDAHFDDWMRRNPVTYSVVAKT